MDHIVLFDDYPEKAEARRAHFDEHLDFLVANRSTIRNAGPLLADAEFAEGGTPVAVGGLWVVKGGSVGDIRRLIEADPLFSTGLRRCWRVHPWVRVFDEGEPTGVRP